MWISFLPVRGTHEFVKQLFSGETFVLGDRRSRVELEVEDIVECPAPEFGEEAEYLALSPIVFMVARPNRSMEYVGPDYPGYADCFYRSVLGMKRFSVGLLMVIQDFHGVCFPNRKEKEFL